MLLALMFAKTPNNTTSLQDSDNDGVIDVWDVCPGSDDTVDLDGNNVSDCQESIVPNWGFDSNGTPFSGVQSGAGYYSNYTANDDGNGWGYSGSKRVGIAGFNSDLAHSVRTGCIAVDSQSVYVFRLQTRLSSTANTPGVRAQVSQFNTYADCLNSNASTWTSGNTVGVHGWNKMGWDFVTGKSTQYVRVYVQAWKDPQQTGHSVNVDFDNVLLHEKSRFSHDDDDSGR